MRSLENTFELFDPLHRLKRRLLIRTRLRALLRWAIYGAYDLFTDGRLGVWTGGIQESPFRALGMHTTKSSHYWELDRIFRHPAVSIGPQDVLVDVGCGKGRVIAWWLSMGLRNRMIGIEMTQNVAAATRVRFAAHTNVNIIAANVLETATNNATLYYLANPFDRPVIQAFKHHLKNLHRSQPGFGVVYYKALYIDVFLSDEDCQCIKLPTSWLYPFETWLIRYGALPGRDRQGGALVAL